MNETEQLKEQIKQLTSENNILKSNFNLSVKYSNKNNLLIQRLSACLAFLKFIDDKSCIIGSIIRNFFEFTLNNSEIGLGSNIGDVSKNDVTILLTTDSPKNRQHITSKFFTIINKLNYYVDQNRNNQMVVKPYFSNYQYIGIKSMNDFVDFNNYTIPRQQLIFSNAFDNFIINFIAWKPSLSYTPSLELLSLNHKGFSFLTSIDTFFTYNLTIISMIEQIAHKQVYINHSLSKLQDNAFPNDKSAITRNNKVNYLLKMFYIIRDYYLPYMECNYTFSGNVPKIFIEKIEDCLITGCSAPYPVFILNCGHIISMMGYKGLITKGESEFSEAIKCPMCRKDLLIKFEEVKKREFLYDTRLEMIDLSLDNKQFNTLLISDDAQKHM